MNEFLPLVDPPADKPPKLDYGSSVRYWFLMLPVMIGPAFVARWPYKLAGFIAVWLFASVWLVARTARQQLGASLGPDKGHHNRWIVGLDFWAIDMFVTMSLGVLGGLISAYFQSRNSQFGLVALMGQMFLVPLVAIPLLRRWGVPHKPTPSLSDWDREYIA